MLKASGNRGQAPAAANGAQMASNRGQAPVRTSPMAAPRQTMAPRQAAPQTQQYVAEEVGQAPAANLPAQVQQGGAVANRSDINIADINAGILEGLEGIGDSNRVGLDGTEFEYKGTERRERELYIIVTYGRKLYQYWDENSSLCQSMDGKSSTDGMVCATCEHKRKKECKFKFEIRWLEPAPDTDEPTEYILTLPTVSALEFVNYVKSLAKEGLSVGQVVTHMTIERRAKDNNKYSVVLFESAGMADAQ